MLNYKINCEIIGIKGDALVCPGSARVKSGASWTIGPVIQDGMCSRSFLSIFPVALAMRHSEEVPMERGKGFVDITCPDGQTTYRLTRVKA